MADNPFSVALPPSPPTAACFTITGIKDASIYEKNTEIGQEMTEFLSIIDSFDQERITPCFDSNLSPTLLFEEGIHDTGIKEAVNFGPFFVVILGNGASLMPVSCRPSANSKVREGLESKQEVLLS